MHKEVHQNSKPNKIVSFIRYDPKLRLSLLQTNVKAVFESNMKDFSVTGNH